MCKVHVANTFFEEELEGKRLTLNGFLRRPVVAQLQFLPILYASQKEFIYVSDLPENPDPRLITKIPKGAEIVHWGPSLAIQKEVGASYVIPSWDQVCRANSKITSFEAAPKLPGAKLIFSEEEIKPGCVLKTPFGSAGRGHFFGKKPGMTFPMIQEPWVERTLDFSTQWEDGKLLGVTLFENDEKGTYKRTYLGDAPQWALDEHIRIAQEIIPKQGNVGVDAFIYKWHGETRLHAVCEINARKTMSYVALQIRRNISYVKSERGALPESLGKFVFSRNLIVE